MHNISLNLLVFIHSFQILISDGFTGRGAVDILKFGTWGNAVCPDARESTGPITPIGSFVNISN
jgi:hypothetical protein